MNQYVKSISKRNETDEKDKNLPIGYLGKVMVAHGEDFENESEFGQALISTEASHIELWLLANYLQALVARRKGWDGSRTLSLSTQLPAGLSR